MSNVTLLPSDKQTTAFTDIWDVIRTCEFNVVFHREKARRIAKLARAIDVSAGLLAAVAGAGILAGTRIPDSAWATVAFLSAITGQLRSVFGLPELELQHRKLQNDHGSALSSLKGVVDRAKDAGGLTYELDIQRQLFLSDSISLLKEMTLTIDSSELGPIQAKINQMYPSGRLWMPPAPPDQVQQ